MTELGWQQVRAWRVRTSKVPKPTSETFSPLASASLTDSTKAFTARSLSFLFKPVFSAMAFTSSGLFTHASLPSRRVEFRLCVLRTRPESSRAPGPWRPPTAGRARPATARSPAAH